VATPPRATACHAYEPEGVVGAYFAAIGSRDVEGIRDVFHNDAELITAIGVTAGREAIAAFYRDTAFQFADLEPRPGPLVVDGNRVAVEITLRMNGTTTAVADVFEVDADGIRRLAVYLGRRLD
jgi:ketosteroid isomerase-like protein